MIQFENLRVTESNCRVFDKGDFSQFINSDQYTTGTTGTEIDKIIKSMVLFVKNGKDTSAADNNLLTMTVLKPKSLWLKLVEGKATDVNGKTGSDIVDYVPYAAGEIIKVKIFSEHQDLGSIISSESGISTANFNDSVTGKIINESVIFQFPHGIDLNEKLRARIAAPNNPVLPPTYKTFSRWL